MDQKPPVPFDDFARVAVYDIDGLQRGKYINSRKLAKSLEEGFGFCNVIFGWDVTDACYDEVAATGWHTAFPDALATIDLTSKRSVPWDGDKTFYLADFSNDPVMQHICPRTLLKKIIHQAGEMGYKAKFAKEYEWFNFTEDSKSLHQKNYQNPEPITQGMFGYSLLRLSQNSAFIEDIINYCDGFGIPIEGFHTETGSGVYEACIVYSDTLEAADKAALFKNTVKEVGAKHGIMPSFMAKWNQNFPGCSGHIHQHLEDLAGNNLFSDGAAYGQMNDLQENYLAGILHCLPHILPMYAPTINSYKRLVPGSWAPTSVSWGFENRTTALRIINRNPENARVEMRVPGADANPYLSISACLASGMYGIKNNLKLPIAATNGNEYEHAEHQQLATNLKDATYLMAHSALAKELFGEPFVHHFVKTREWEVRQFESAVTNFELKRYFEII